MGAEQSQAAETGCILPNLPTSWQSFLDHALQDEQRPFHILCYGDGLTAGYSSAGQVCKPYGQVLAETLRKLGIACRVTVRGLVGYSAQRMVADVDDDDCEENRGLNLDLQEGPHDLVVIMAGSADLAAGFPAEQIVAHVQELHRCCHYCRVPTVALAPPSKAHEREALVKSLADWVQTTSWVLACIDPEDFVPRSATDKWDADGVHMTAAGSYALGNHLVSRVLPVLSHLDVHNAAEATRQWSLQQQRRAEKERRSRLAQQRRNPAYGGA
eukprot:TRINITY_DN22372_c0_g1_i1.p1 TRINITY_DN22372_c0_g1~~TRINITY_DN22372_c0_g1_i1.p1  ORF type:complete len:271 (+),score=26.46 TRINITY_DN22372_c0_g1_i1:102-914(+)